MLVLLQVLQKAGLPDTQLMHLRTHVFQLQCAFERMALVKEYRYCTLHFPPFSLCGISMHPLSTLLLFVLSRVPDPSDQHGSFSLVRLVWQMSVQVTCLIEDLSGWKVLWWLDDQGGMSQQFKGKTWSADAVHMSSVAAAY